MQVQFLFWNICGGSGSKLHACLTRLAQQSVDVFMFAECPDAALTDVLTALNSQAINHYQSVNCRSKRVRVCYREDATLSQAVWNERYYTGINDRITALECQPQRLNSFLLIGTHLPSQARGLSQDGLAERARAIARDIQTIETDCGHKRTLFVGDMNMNPFDSGMVTTSAFHAVMSRQLVGVVPRHSLRKDCDVFYNPMWSCFGDRPATRTLSQQCRPPGTYYHDRTDDAATTFWQMYDQVLLRPELMERLSSLEILATDGTDSFVSAEGKPRKNAFSDHLPIHFEITL